MSVADGNKTRNVTLAGQQYVIKQIPMAKMRKIGPKLSVIMFELVIEKINADQPDTITSALDKLLDKLLTIPHEVLSLFIPTVSKEIFEDEENGVTFPEFYEALRVALELNRLDVLKGFFTKAGSTLALMKR